MEIFKSFVLVMVAFVLSACGTNLGSQVGTLLVSGGTDESGPSDSPIVSGSPDTVIQISGGNEHTCAVINGAALCWGRGGAGRLGNNSQNNSLSPTPVFGLSSGVASISAGYMHTCAVVNGAGMCWGANGNFQCGPTPYDRMTPTLVNGLESGVSWISAGGSHSCAIVNGGAKCWGAGSNGQLGNNSNMDSPQAVDVVGLKSGVTSITTGGTSPLHGHSCAIVNGAAKCWGTGVQGQLGGPNTNNSPIPVQVIGLESGVTAIAASTLDTCAIANGDLYCFGAMTGGATPVKLIEGGVSAVSLGLSHVCAVVNGDAKCWGSNTLGELGSGSLGGSSVLVSNPVSTLLGGVSGIAVGGSLQGSQKHSCAVKAGTIKCWGGNGFGQLGNGNASIASSATPVSTY